MQVKSWWNRIMSLSLTHRKVNLFLVLTLRTSFWKVALKVLPSLFMNQEFYPTWLTVWPLCRLLFPGLRHLPLRATLFRGWCTISPARPCSSGERSSAPPASCSTPGWRSKPAAASASRRFPRRESGGRFCHPRRRTLNPDHTPERVDVWEVGFSGKMTQDETWVMW